MSSSPNKPQWKAQSRRRHEPRHKLHSEVEAVFLNFSFFFQRDQNFSENVGGGGGGGHSAAPVSFDWSNLRSWSGEHTGSVRPRRKELRFHSHKITREGLVGVCDQRPREELTTGAETAQRGFDQLCITVILWPVHSSERLQRRNLPNLLLGSQVFINSLDTHTDSLQPAAPRGKLHQDQIRTLFLLIYNLKWSHVCVCVFALCLQQFKFQTLRVKTSFAWQLYSFERAVWGFKTILEGKRLETELCFSSGQFQGSGAGILRFPSSSWNKTIVHWFVCQKLTIKREREHINRGCTHTNSVNMQCMTI